MPIVGDAVASGHVLFDINQFDGLSMLGQSYTNITTWSNKNTTLTQNQIFIADPDNDGDVVVLAKAIRGAKEDDTNQFLATSPPNALGVKQLIMEGFGHATGAGGSVEDGICRNVTAIVCAWDIMRQYSEQVTPIITASEERLFRQWLLTLQNSSNKWASQTFLELAEKRSNNHGCFARAGFTSVAVYLNQMRNIRKMAGSLVAWMGDTTSSQYPKLDYSTKDTYYNLSTTQPVSILPVGAFFWTDQVNHTGSPDPNKPADGCQPCEAHRGQFDLDVFFYPTPETQYLYESLQAAVAQSAILAENGYPAVWTWQDSAIGRAYRFARDVNPSSYADGIPRTRDYVDTNGDDIGELNGADNDGQDPSGDDIWACKVMDFKYGFNYATGLNTTRGKGMIGLEWYMGL